MKRKMPEELVYVNEPDNGGKFTKDYDKFYSGFARIYEWVIKVFPFWRRWISAALPHIQGSQVLEISFGTGYLMTQLAACYEAYGLEYNQTFLSMLKDKLTRQGLTAHTCGGDVLDLPFEDGFFDSIINTMAFTAYPDGIRAMSEIHRVLKPGGRLIMVDIGYPRDRNRMGMLATKAWIAMGDIVRNMDPIFQRFQFDYMDEEIGGFGSVHLYVAQKS